MHAQWSSAEDLDKVYVTGLFYQFVYEQFRQARLAELNEPAPDLATQAAQYIRENCRQSITLETIAGHFHYSTRYLTRVFKRRFGMTPNDYLTKTRMEWTRRLLAHTDASIREAAESVGYTDIYYFSKLFKKITGITPRQYKLQHTLGASSNRPHFRSESFIAHSSSAMDNVDNDSPYQQDGWRLTEMKKGFKPTLAASVLLSLSLLATACGGASPEAQPSVKPHASESSVPDAKAETRSYTDALNRVVTIPASPEKAVVLTYGGYLLPLGIKPIGVDQNVLNAYPDRMADVANVGEGKGNVEAVAALQPDLIIIPDFYGEETAALYEPIAPTVAVAWGGDPDVVKTLRTMGDLMNRKTEAESWIAKFEEKLQFIRDSIGVKLKPGATALTFILYNGEILAGGETGTLGELIYKDFGFELPKPYKSLANGGGVISLEDFAAQPADYFFTQMTEEELEPMYELFKSPVYQTIPAVKENRIYNVSREKWNYGPYLVEEGVDMLIEQMSKL
jgi:iron complex transport system substrate-binding protein